MNIKLKQDVPTNQPAPTGLGCLMNGNYLQFKRKGDRVKFFFMNADGTCEQEQDASVEEAEEFLMQLTGMAPHEAAALLVDTKAH